MSKYDYDKSKEIGAQDYPFSALIMAAAKKADSVNFNKLDICFPEIIGELKERYHSPDGFTKNEKEQ